MSFLLGNEQGFLGSGTLIAYDGYRRRLRSRSRGAGTRLDELLGWVELIGFGWCRKAKHCFQSLLHLLILMIREPLLADLKHGARLQPNC